MNPEILLNLLFILVISTILIYTGLKNKPGIGILAAVILIAIQLLYSRKSLALIGFEAPKHWWNLILAGLGIGLILQLLSVVLLEPFTEKITGMKHNHSIVLAVKGNWKLFLQWMLIVWLLVAVLEEGIYRGYLMTEFKKIFGMSIMALIINVTFSSIVFGLSHGYQGISGILSTGILGAILGIIFIFSNFNLWLVIFTHGFIDTIGIGLIALGWDQKLQV